MTRRLLLAIIALATVLTLTGCLGSGGSKYLRGKVEFHDTGLGIASTVTIGSKSIVTNYGNFTLSLDPGVYPYTIHSALGEFSGVAEFKEGKTTKLIVPAFDGWSRDIFNAMLTWSYSTGDVATVRWDHSPLQVWVQPSSEYPHPSPTQRGLAYQAIAEWTDTIGVLDYAEVVNANQADLVITWVDDITQLGRCTAWPQSSGYIRHAIVQIDITLTTPGVYRHEVGHCFGLNHSSDPDHLMFPVSTPQNQAIHEHEDNFARLLYSLPPKTPGFN